MLKNSNWIFNISYFIPKRVLKNPSIPVPSHEDLKNIILCLLPPGAGVEGVQRKVLQGSSHQRNSSNQTKHSGLVLWELLLGNLVSSSGAPKAPGRFSAKSTCKEQPGCASQSLCPCSCRDQQAGNTIPWPQCPCRDTLSLALHKLGEVIHRGDQPLPLPRLVAGRGVLGDLGRGF